MAGIDRARELLRDRFGYPDFRGPQVRVIEAVLDGADLREANLEGACLIGASLVKARLAGCNLADADLSGAILEGGCSMDGSKVVPEPSSQKSAAALVEESSESEKY